MCPFWEPLVQQFDTDPVTSPINAFRRDGSGKVVRREHLRDLLLEGELCRPAEALAYASYNARLFRAVRNRVGERTGHTPQVLVDASKDPYRLAWLGSSEELDIRAILITKDPRAYVDSITRPEPLESPTKFCKAVGRWTVENALLQRLGEVRFPGRFKIVHYEELATAPLRTLQSLGSWLDLRYEPEHIDAFERNPEMHGVSGNWAMRWGPQKVRYDERWARSLSPALARFIWTATTPARFLLDYR
jgi:hypothetical protein